MAKEPTVSPMKRVVVQRGVARKPATIVKPPPPPPPPPMKK